MLLDEMPASRTRSQKTRDVSPALYVGALANGNGSAHGPVTLEPLEPKENIFLFYPNLIGQYPGRTPFFEPVLMHMAFRILTDHSCRGLSLLHASSPTHVLSPLQYLMPP